MFRIAYLILLCTSMLLLPVSAKRLTDGFRVAKMHLEIPFHPEWETGSLSDLNEILNQPFTYLSKGAQCYVFASADGKYVIKLFRFEQPMNPIRSVLKKKRKKELSSQAKAMRLFRACMLAYELAPLETGLIYIHLNPGDQKFPRFYCKDPIGRKVRIPLEKIRFAIQKRAAPFRATLLQAIERKDPDQVKRRIDEFLSLLRSRTAKGIRNSDPNLSRNFGFLEERAVEFDFGNYVFMEKGCEKEEVKRYAGRLRRWLKKTAPEWVSYLDEQLDTKQPGEIS